MNKPEQTENDLKKEYLKGFERAVRQMNRFEERIQEIRDSRMSISVASDGMPHAHNTNDLSSYAAMLDQELSRYLKARYKRDMKCKEIRDKIERLDNEDEKDVLTYRYIKLMKWEEICTNMHISWKTVHRLHGRALKNFVI